METIKCVVCGEKFKRKGLKKYCSQLCASRYLRFIPKNREKISSSEIASRFIASKKLSDLFWSKVEMIPFHSCWEWVASLDSRGYGHFWVSPKLITATRISYAVANGQFNDELHVLHTCDNPRCVNPKHLFLGAHQDNMSDKAKKGRVVSRNAELTHCKRGHAFDGSTHKNGSRKCVKCRRYLVSRWYHQNRAAIPKEVTCER